MSRTFDLDLDDLLTNTQIGSSDDDIPGLVGGAQSDESESDEDLPGLMENDSDTDTTDDSLPGLVDVNEASSSEESSEDETPLQQMDTLHQALGGAAAEPRQRQQNAFANLRRGFLSGGNSNSSTAAHRPSAAAAQAPPPPPPGFSSQAHDGDRWACIQCTYANSGNRSSCEMCGSEKIQFSQPGPTPADPEAAQKASAETQEEGGWRKRKKDKKKKKKKKKKQQNNAEEKKEEEEKKMEAKEVAETFQQEPPKKTLQIEEMLDILPSILNKGFRAYNLDRLEELEFRLDRSLAEVKKAKANFARRKRIEKDKDREDRCCVICLDAPKTVVLLPCKHLCVCNLCSDTIMHGLCPICRKDINDKVTGVCR